MSKILNTKNKSLKDKLKNVSKKTGCYIYKNANGKIIYVGKAKNLKSRVSSYFVNYPHESDKINKLVEKISDIETIEVDTEIEALILENNLIKKYRPKYNILMKDDKSYIYVKFEKIRKSTQPKPSRKSTYKDFPSIHITREKKNDGADYFGPFPDARPIQRVLKKLRKVFPYCTAGEVVYQVSENPLEIETTAKKPCFYYQIGLCKGACAGYETKSEYLKRFKSIRSFFEGKKIEIVQKLESEMLSYSRKKDYEQAAYVRDKMNDFKYAMSNITIDNEVDDISIMALKKKEKEQALSEVVQSLNFPSEKLSLHKNFRIECYDISNIQGTNSTGSMVVMIDGQSDPSLYRRFKIRNTDGPDDFAMLQEVLGRRLAQFINSQNISKKNKSLGKRMSSWKPDDSFSQKPDLIIIDGGKGQLTATYEVLKYFELDDEIPIVGLAKKEEILFKLTEQFDKEKKAFQNPFKQIKLARKSEGLFLIQRIRDEAHRFAKSYHKKLRNQPYKKNLN